MSTTEAEAIKQKILQVAALTDRGQRLNTLVADTYQEKRTQIADLATQLEPMSKDITEEALEGEWELAYADVELFRSSPFFFGH